MTFPAYFQREKTLQVFPCSYSDYMKLGTRENPKKEIKPIGYASDSRHAAQMLRNFFRNPDVVYVIQLVKIDDCIFMP